MSRQQLLNMYQRQIALGGSSSGGDGGLFTPASRAGLAGYRAWRASYKAAHPAASRDELKAAWRMHKARLGEPMPRGRGALVGGRRKPKGLSHCTAEKMGPSGLMRCAQMAPGPRGSALVGGVSVSPMGYGVRVSKGVRHCMEEKKGPSGLLRCSKFMAGPRSAMHGQALVGGFPGQARLFKQWRDENKCSIQKMKRAFASARRAYDANSSEDFRAGVRAAAAALGVMPSADFVEKLRPPRRRGQRAVPAREPLPAFGLEEVYAQEPQAVPAMAPPSAAEEAAAQAEMERYLEELGL